MQSQERNRVIVDTALDAVISMDAGGIITDWNAQAVNIFGWEREEALGRRVSETVIPSGTGGHERDCGISSKPDKALFSIVALR